MPGFGWWERVMQWAIPTTNVNVREPRPMDMILVDGKRYIVQSYTLPTREVGLIPLGEMLASHLFVDGDDEPLSVADMLIEAGWQPPAHEGVQWLHWYDNPHAPRETLVGALMDLEAVLYVRNALNLYLYLARVMMGDVGGGENRTLTSFVGELEAAVHAKRPDLGLVRPEST